MVFTRRNMGEDFDPAEQRVSVQDCQQLGQAVANHPSLTVLSSEVLNTVSRFRK